MTMTAPPTTSMRDRLRTDYQWTPRQKQVLELIARGKTNTEIGEELGISLDGAKWHVGEILSKLQAESREEAADYWRRYNGLAPRFERIFRGIVGGVATKWVAGTAVVGLAGVATAVVVAIAINPGNDEPATGNPSDPPPAATPPPGGGSGEPNVPPSGVLSITIQQPVASVPNSIVYVVTGCIQCDGPDESLQKHVANSSGALTSTTLLRSNEGVLEGWTLGNVDASTDGATLAAVVCDQEYCGGMGQPRADANWRVLISADQGLTWGVAHTFTGNYGTLWNVTPNGFALTSTIGDGEGAERTHVTYFNKTITSLSAPTVDAWNPLVLRDGSVLWTTRERGDLLRGDGSPMGLLAPDGTEAINGFSELPDGTLAIPWATQTADGYYSEILQLVRPDGTVLSAIDGNANYLLRALSGGLAIGNIAGSKAGLSDDLTSYPALLDLNRGTSTPIGSDAFTQQRGRNRFIAFQTGPFATVAADGDCLNVRESASTSATSLACYRDGVLLRDLGETAEAGGATWLKVATPDGRVGWASTEFLER